MSVSRWDRFMEEMGFQLRLTHEQDADKTRVWSPEKEGPGLYSLQSYGYIYFQLCHRTSIRYE